MFNTIKKIIGMKHTIDSKIFRKALVQYPYNSESSGSYIYNITGVSAKENKGKIVVTICTHLPGILIGKAGHQITEIKSLMEHYSGKNIDIFIREEKMFSNLY